MSADSKRPASERRRQASRKNGAKSNGPITASGKKMSRRNALKHGLLSEVVIFEDPNWGDTLRSLREGLREDLKPQGTLEDLLVDEIAVCYWKLQRALISEMGEVKKNLFQELLRVQVENQEVACDLTKATFNWDQPDEQNGKGYLAWRFKSDGVKVAIEFLEELLSVVKEDSSIPPAYLGPLAIIFRDEPHFLGMLAATIDDDESPTDPESGADKAVNSETNLPSLTFLLEVKVKLLRLVYERLLKAESAQTEHLKNALCLPTAATSEKILRYESAITRRLYRAMDQLERLQRRRRGEYGLPR